MAYSVPTGNFGDIFAGYVAAQMGLPIAQLMIATNVNDILARTLLQAAFMRPAKWWQRPAHPWTFKCPSNFERLLFELAGRDAARVRFLMGSLAQSGRFEMSEGELQLMRALFAAERVDQEATIDVMRTSTADCGFQIDPHSAVGIGAAQRAVLADGVPMVTLATAHPAKFPKAVLEAYGPSRKHRSA